MADSAVLQGRRFLIDRVLAADIAQYDTELIATQACHGIRFARVFDQAASHFAQHLVTGIVTQGIVDDLELVEIQVEQGHVPAVSPGAPNGHLQAIMKQHAVGQSSERVVVGQVMQFSRACLRSMAVAI